MQMTTISFYFIIFIYYWTCLNFLQVFARDLSRGRKCQSIATCIDIWKCPYYVNLLYSTGTPRPLHVILDIQRNLCGFVNRNVPKVCCMKLTTTTTTTTTTTPISIISEDDEILNHKNLGLLPFHNCGHIIDDVRITSGTKATFGEFPWMALIVYNTAEGPDFRCGGTLINERYVLTAAHCIENSTILGIRLGEYNISTEKECARRRQKCTAEDYLISKISIHPLYDTSTFLNDIALLRLSSHANLTNDKIQPICLPVGTANKDITYQDAIITGWGVTETGQKSEILQKAQIPVLPIETCRKMYQLHKPITRNQICAGGSNNKDSCAGDSGGPLKVVGRIGNSLRYIQYGIVSYGPRFCGIDGRPGIYTKITEYMKWILEELEEG